ncbi:ThyX-like thymidylate synthase [Microbacterium phage PauloDiaboli]|nr:ThyX-like thymidylate synthase [Microbacterium phage PauloDiaboli]QWY83974.1 ThyX-like thymidylate synthase [Microbacterium phage A3Wally]
MSIELFSQPTVTLIDHMGDDNSIVRSARVSVTGEQLADGFPSEEEAQTLPFGDLEERRKRATGLINYLVREKHGSPFEQNSMTFYVKAPIFVFREFMRHRVGFSYNEMSGRYTKLKPEFWIPGEDRPLVNIGTSAKPEMAPGSIEQWERQVKRMSRVYDVAWEAYEEALEDGIANEVARAVLPVGIYSQMYVTLNLRSALNFLSLRTHEKEAAHVSRPQREIEDVARIIETHVAELFPVAYAKYNEHGRVAP